MQDNEWKHRERGACLGLKRVNWVRCGMDVDVVVAASRSCLFQVQTPSSCQLPKWRCQKRVAALAGNIGNNIPVSFIVVGKSDAGRNSGFCCNICCPCKLIKDTDGAFA